MKKGLIILAVVVVLFGGYVWSTYNSLIVADNVVAGQWSQVENQYQRRFDLIPNYVNLVKGAMKQEQQIFDGLAEARTRYSGASTVSEKAVAASQVDSALSRLIAVVENYPNLKSIDTVENAQAELAGTENRIAVERGRFNEAVRSFNTMIKTFPRNILASMFGFGEKAYYESATGSDVPPEINL